MCQNLTSGFTEQASFSALPDVKAAAALLCVLLLLFFLCASTELATGGSGKGREADTFDCQKTPQIFNIKGPERSLTHEEENVTFSSALFARLVSPALGCRDTNGSDERGGAVTAGSLTGNGDSS